MPADRGVAVLVDGVPVALFRLTRSGAGEEWYAVSHIDPLHGAPVIARGLVGSVGDVPTVASPLHKERYDLRTGACLDDPDARLATYAVTVTDGWVHVATDTSGSSRGNTPETHVDDSRRG